MSRSRKKNPILGVASKSEKKDKQIMNRILRHKVNTVLKKTPIEELDNFIEPKKSEIIDIWDMSKDGKHRISKDSEYYAKSLRK